MARLVGVYAMAHSPYCFMKPEQWNEVRATRSLREDVPQDDLTINQEKSARIKQAFSVMKSKIAEAKPDVIVMFGDDQLECFDFNNYPSFSVYVGDEFKGSLASRDPRLGGTQSQAGLETLKGHPQLATSILTGLLQRRFDPAFALDMPKPDRGLGHAFMRPAEAVTDMRTPIVPILVNCYFAPQVTADRCYDLGKAVREIIEDYPDDLRVAVLGSGGLWHTPGAKDAYLDEDFDRNELAFMEAGDARGMAEYFDAYHIPSGDRSQPMGERGRTATGMPASVGPQGGTREICNWVASAAVADGSRASVIDYVPVYASPVGAGFAYYPQV